ncbi:MAG: siphovirus Gp157 family protein [Methylomicrobium sp.]
MYSTSQAMVPGTIEKPSETKTAIIAANSLDLPAEAIKAAKAPESPGEPGAQRMKDYLKGNMEHTGITKIECPYFKLSIQNNPAAAHIFDESAISGTIQGTGHHLENRHDRDQKSELGRAKHRF